MAGDYLEKVVEEKSTPKPNPEVTKQPETPKTLEQILYDPKLHQKVETYLTTNHTPDRKEILTKYLQNHPQEQAKFARGLLQVKENDEEIANRVNIFLVRAMKADHQDLQM
jgi:hypothetical protein